MSLDDLCMALTRSGRRSRADGVTSPWENSSGVEVGQHRARYTSSPTLGPSEVEGLLAHDWRARREITQMMGDLLRGGVELLGLPEWVDVEAVQSWLEGDSLDGEAVGLLDALTNLWAEGDSFGGAICVAVIEDGLHPSEPVDYSRIRTVKQWAVLDRYCAYPYRTAGPAGPVDYWLLAVNDGRLPVVEGTYQIVHPSRVCVHAGMWMPGRWTARNNGWGLSRLELLRDQRDTLALGHGSLGRLLQKSSQDVVAFAELSELIEESGNAVLLAKLAQMRLQLHSDGLLVLDAGIAAKTGQTTDAERRSDTFASVARPLGGAGEIASLQYEDWRRGSSMPAVIADGEVSGGLNSGEDAGAWRSWDGTVAAEFKRSLRRKLTWGLGLVFASKDGPTGGRVPSTWTAERVSIAEPDHELDAKTSQAEAVADMAYLDAGVLTEQEVRQWRHVDGKRGGVRVEKSDTLPEPDDDLEAAAMAEVGPGETGDPLGVEGGAQ